VKLHGAPCQFPISADVHRNLRYVARQLRIAEERGADVAHFPEGCLSGYAGVDFPTFRGFDWDRLEASMREVLTLARKHRVWVVLGSAHRLTGRRKPHNSLHIIDPRGRLADRYDKRFCAGDRTGRTGELNHFTPGDHPSVFTIRGVRCGALICHECRYPELYRDYQRRGVRVVFHSFHAGNFARSRFSEMQAAVGARRHPLNSGTTLPAITMPATMQAAAASNHVWISCPNTSARESCFSSFFVRPDGVTTGRLRRHTAGVLVSEVDTSAKFYDSSEAWRDRAMRGIFHSGTLVRDPRSKDRTTI